MPRPSKDLTNYCLTPDGVINKLDTYWDKLRDITEDLEDLTKNTVRKLLNFYCGCLLGILPVFALKPSKTLGVIVMLFLVVCTVSFVAIQFANYLEFRILRKRGVLLYRELGRELESEYYEEEAPFEERILLNGFRLATHLPINQYFYLVLLFLLPLITGGLFGFYYLYY
jgi:hypothetical protein